MISRVPFEGAVDILLPHGDGGLTRLLCLLEGESSHSELLAEIHSPTSLYS